MPDGGYRDFVRAGFPSGLARGMHQHGSGQPSELRGVKDEEFMKNTFSVLLSRLGVLPSGTYQ